IQKSGASIHCAAGEEGILADASVPDEELIPADGVGRTVVAGKIAVEGGRIRKTQFNTDEMMRKESFFACAGSGSMLTRKTDPSVSDNGNPFKPISHIETGRNDRSN